MANYGTGFPLNQSPILENGIWVSPPGNTFSTQVNTSGGIAFGTQTGTSGFDDSIALVTPDFGPNQTVTIKIHKAPVLSGTGFREVECILRASATEWYEFNLAFDGQYQDIVYINNGAFTFLNPTPGSGGPAGQVVDGLNFTASVQGTTLSTYLNGVPWQSVTDTRLSSGKVGMGFYIEDSGSGGIVNDEYCADSFFATDGVNSVFFGSGTTG